MIWVPKKEECIVWTEMDDGVHIIYSFDKKNKKEFQVQFVWMKAPRIDGNWQVHHEMNYDPYYLLVQECMGEHVLMCSLIPCSSHPQLRYNKIINKWFCCCPSSAAGTKNDDQDEIDTKLVNLDHIDQRHGYCDNPIEAILRWNESCAEDYLIIAHKKLDELTDYLKKAN